MLILSSEKATFVLTFKIPCPAGPSVFVKRHGHPFESRGRPKMHIAVFIHKLESLCSNQTPRRTRPFMSKLVVNIPNHPRANGKNVKFLFAILQKDSMQQVLEIEHSSSFPFVPKRQLIPNLLGKITVEQDCEPQCIHATVSLYPSS